MGELELNKDHSEIVIYSNIYLYGDAASEELAQRFCEEIETMWNEAEGSVVIDNKDYSIRFVIQGTFSPKLSELDVLENTNPRNNYFRVEEYSPINISWVDGLGSNTGYMLLENLYQGSTTAAHEYGHTLGLDHPKDLNLIGKGIPGIMYPRGTLVDPKYQYDFKALPGEKGGTIHPMYRRVQQEDIDLLGITNLLKYDQRYIGKFSSVYHEKHIRPVAV